MGRWGELAWVVALVACTSPQPRAPTHTPRASAPPAPAAPTASPVAPVRVERSGVYLEHRDGRWYVVNATDATLSTPYRRESFGLMIERLNANATWEFHDRVLYRDPMCVFGAGGEQIGPRQRMELTRVSTEASGHFRFRFDYHDPRCPRQRRSLYGRFDVPGLAPEDARAVYASLRRLAERSCALPGQAVEALARWSPPGMDVALLDLPVESLSGRFCIMWNLVSVSHSMDSLVRWFYDRDVNLSRAAGVLLSRVNEPRAWPRAEELRRVVRAAFEEEETAPAVIGAEFGAFSGWAGTLPHVLRHLTQATNGSMVLAVARGIYGTTLQGLRPADRQRLAALLRRRAVLVSERNQWEVRTAITWLTRGWAPLSGGAAGGASDNSWVCEPPSRPQQPSCAADADSLRAQVVALMERHVWAATIPADAIEESLPACVPEENGGTPSP